MFSLQLIGEEFQNLVASLIQKVTDRSRLFMLSET